MRGLETVLGNPFSLRLGWALLAFLWQGTLVATLLACAGVALRRQKAAVRYAAGCGAGSGIGLVISRQIAEAHGGSLTLENRLDRQGCRASLVLPLTGD
jgi:Signal transduction histidine kinase involved in nitrogen fixation and metabolism regulation